MRVLNESIPLAKFEQWHALLHQTRGNYINDPEVQGDNVIVSYEPGDYMALVEGWKKINTRGSYNSMKWKKMAYRILTTTIKS